MPSWLEVDDLVLRAIPNVYVLMPEEAAKAVPLLEQGIALDDNYASAHGWLAWCRQLLFLRGGSKESDRTAAIRHARYLYFFALIDLNMGNGLSPPTAWVLTQFPAGFLFASDR